MSISKKRITLQKTSVIEIPDSITLESLSAYVKDWIQAYGPTAELYLLGHDNYGEFEVRWKREETDAEYEYRINEGDAIRRRLKRKKLNELERLKSEIAALDNPQPHYDSHDQGPISK